MSCEDLVNLICAKLRTGRIEFIQFDMGACGIWFRYGGVEYFALAGDPIRVFVETYMQNNYSRWVEGVLNGKTRDEKGVLV